MTQVYKLDRIALTWTEVRNLGGRGLFVGENTSMSLLASSFSNGPEDSGVYNMDDGSIEQYPLDMEELEYPFPCWIIPSLFIRKEMRRDRYVDDRGSCSIPGHHNDFLVGTVANPHGLEFERLREIRVTTIKEEQNRGMIEWIARR